MPIGEIYLNSIDKDGTGQGYLLELLDLLPKDVPVPIIMAGGAGKYSHFCDALGEQRIDAAATAHLFNFVNDGMEQSRNNLVKEGFDIPVWDVEKARSLKNTFQL